MCPDSKRLILMTSCHHGDDPVYRNGLSLILKCSDELSVCFEDDFVLEKPIFCYGYRGRGRSFRTCTSCHGDAETSAFAVIIKPCKSLSWKKYCTLLWCPSPHLLTDTHTHTHTHTQTSPLDQARAYYSMSVSIEARSRLCLWGFLSSLLLSSVNTYYAVISHMFRDFC